MFENLIMTLHAFALAAGFWGIFLVAFMQEIIPPIPSTAVAMSLGLLLFAGSPVTAGTMFDLTLAIGIPMALGLTAGALIVYGIVYYGGKPFLLRYGAYIGIEWSDVEKIQARMKGGIADEVLLFTARAFPFVPSALVNVVAGVVRWRPISFTLLTFFGTVIRGVWSAFIGWQLGNTFTGYAATIERIQTFVFVIVIFGVPLFLLYRKRAILNKQANP